MAADCLTTTCDNCFAHRSEYGKTDPRPVLTFTLCDTCKVVHYCSSDCSSSAWLAYHEFECHILAKVLASEPGWVDTANPRSVEFRTIIRILTLHDSGMIPNREWEEMMGLQPQLPAADKEPHFIRGLTEMLELIVKYEVTKLGMDDVEKLIRAVSHATFSEHSIGSQSSVFQQPLLHPTLDPLRPSSLQHQSIPDRRSPSTARPIHTLLCTFLEP
ncbi:hypothetical protein DL98DRAFT_419322 [Cadophora sp. DSE1049]|nr:hypothetical protein DL98DRAFT_419322 [Cadophora sp. DSE1049]